MNLPKYPKIKSNEVWSPFWGERGSIITGLDQLGLQDIPEATFQLMLPGLNSVTGRIRYYAFYCWMLDIYSKGVGGAYASDGASTDPALQRRFLRSGEFIIALISQHPDVELPNIPGSNFAGKQWEEHPLGPFSLEDSIYNAEGKTEKSYWKHPSGAFGQYYLGSMRDMGLVQLRSEDDKVFVRTENEESADWISGKELADAFDLSIGIEVRDAFIEAIRSGFLEFDKIELLLNTMRPDQIPHDSVEHDVLSRLLCQIDDPLVVDDQYYSRYRSETIKLYLVRSVNFSDTNVAFWQQSYRKFTALAYLDKGRGEMNSSTWFGWYHYMFYELWQFSNGAMFSAMLRLLVSEWNGMTRIDIWIDKMTNQVIERLDDSHDISKGKTSLIEVINQFNHQSEWTFVEIIKRLSSPQDDAVAAFSLLFTIINRNHDELIKLRLFDVEELYKGQRSGVNLMILLLEEFGDKPVVEFISHFLERYILLKHHAVAIRKMRGRSQSSQKFMFESGWVRFLNPYEPSFMGPRLPNLENFLEDLGLINEEGIVMEHSNSWVAKYLDK